jgi:hypothetical protein
VVDDHAFIEAPNALPPTSATNTFAKPATSPITSMGNCLSKPGAETPIGDPYRAQDNDRPGVPGTLEEPKKSTVVRRMGNERVNENSALFLTQVDPAGDIAASQTGASGGTNVEVSVVIPSSTMPFSKRADIIMKPELINAEGKTKMLDAGIQVVDAFQKVADLLGLVLPNYLGPVLETLSAVLERLKVSTSIC